MIADNALPILQARRHGMRPSEMIMVSVVGPVQTPNYLVLADPSKRYDWRWVRDLDICVWIGDLVQAIGTLKDIALLRPAYFGIWQAECQWGAQVYLIPTADDIRKPTSQWRFELDYLPWLLFQNEDFANAAHP